MALSLFLWIVIVIAVVLVLYIIAKFNSLISLKNNIAKSWANIDVLLKQRSDELPNLVETVKGYMKHEKAVFTELAKARSGLLDADTLSEKAKADAKISNSLKTLFAVAESYPTLKANENFLKLQERITGLENELADRREFYNDSVTIFNTRIQSFPDVIIAKIFKFTSQELFKASGSEREVVKVNM